MTNKYLELISRSTWLSVRFYVLHLRAVSLQSLYNCNPQLDRVTLSFDFGIFFLYTFPLTPKKKSKALTAKASPTTKPRGFLYIHTRETFTWTSERKRERRKERKKERKTGSFFYLFAIQFQLSVAFLQLRKTGSEAMRSTNWLHAHTSKKNLCEILSLLLLLYLTQLFFIFEEGKQSNEIMITIDWKNLSLLCVVVHDRKDNNKNMIVS